jgi:hypothetical protein
MAKQKATLNKNTPPEKELPPFFTISRIKRFSGVFLTLLSIILLIAFISYCFSWKEDQGNVVDPSWKILWSQDQNVSNIMGRLGAFLSHFFMYNLFGIGSFILPYLIFTFGVNITFSKRIFPLLKISLNIALGLIIIPLFAKYLFPNIDFPIGGGMGKMLYQWLSTLIGIVGLGIVLFGGLSSYFIWKFRKSIYTAWKNYQIKAEKERLERIEKEKIGGESLIPEEKANPIPHFEDDTFEILKEPLEEKIEEDEMTPYAEPENIIFETKIKHPEGKALAESEMIGFSIEENNELNENEFEYNDELPKKKTVAKALEEVPTLELEAPIVEEVSSSYC